MNFENLNLHPGIMTGVHELGYTELKDHFKYDSRAADNLDWFYHLTGGHTHTDFFAIRPTDYSKANEGEDFEDIW